MLTLILFVIIGLAASVLLKNNRTLTDRSRIETLLRTLVIIYVAASFIGFLMPDAFTMRYEWDFSYLAQHHDAFHAILRAFDAMAIITLPMAVFFKKKSFIRVSSFIVLPAGIVSLFCADRYLAYYTSTLTFEHATVFGEKLWPYLTNPVFRSVLFALNIGLAVLIALCLCLTNKEDLRFKEGKEIKDFFLLAAGLFLVNMPIATVQQILGHTAPNIPFAMFTPSHIVYMIWIAVEGVILTLIFKGKTPDDRYILLLCMSLSLLFQYFSYYKTSGVIIASRYPLQLCNISSVLFLITLIKKDEKLFHFMAVVNVTGALIAIVLCDSQMDGGVLYCMNIHYMVEHIKVMLVPILCLTLHVFEPLKASDHLDFAKGFTIYFIVVLIVGTLLNGLVNITGNDYFACNFLFMFDAEAAVRLVGDFAGVLFAIKVPLLQYFELHLGQLCIYLAFMIICTGIFFLLLWIFRDRKETLSAID